MIYLLAYLPFVMWGVGALIMLSCYLWRGWMPARTESGKGQPVPRFRRSTRTTRNLSAWALDERGRKGCVYDCMVYQVDTLRSCARLQKYSDVMPHTATRAKRIQKRRDCTITEYTKQIAGL